MSFDRINRSLNCCLILLSLLLWHGSSSWCWYFSAEENVHSKRLHTTASAVPFISATDACYCFCCWCCWWNIQSIRARRRILTNLSHETLTNIFIIVSHVQFSNILEVMRFLESHIPPGHWRWACRQRKSRGPTNTPTTIFEMILFLSFSVIVLDIHGKALISGEVLRYI